VCGPFVVTDALFPAAYTLDSHFHDRTVLGITLAGGWESIVGRTRLANAPGMLHVEPAGDCHVNRFGKQAARVIVIQPDQRDSLLQPFRSLLASAFQTEVGPSGLQIGQRLRHELRWPDDLTPLAVEGLCLDMLVSASRLQRAGKGHAPTWLLRTVDYMHSQFLERPSLRQLSSVAGVSPEHLNREFRRSCRTSAAQYLRRLRLEWAAERLTHSDESLADIACAAGFADQSHFTRQFKRQFGATPSAFRAASRTIA
jgi:AraC family transcriptional regulator